MSFALVATLTAIATLGLGAGWLFFGHKMLARWGLQADQTALIVGRRLGVIYTSIGLLLLLARNTPASDLRDIACVGLLVATAGLAFIGLFELLNKRVSRFVLVSVVVELFLAFGFASILLASHTG